MALTTNEIRAAFLKYFESKGHTRERSSSLIPQNDPTLLFTNAGMNQFKDCFTGVEKRPYVRATTCQKCVRAGGKHNDLENVGFTKRHHTFFEMLGNFSFGDYFKEGAIKFAWEFLTVEMKLPKDKIWVSVFEQDDEAEELWLKISGLPKERIVRMGEKDNFWSMGDTGPCGPCSEIYIDRGEAFGKNETIFDGGERFLEIWNLVFMQFEKFADGSMKPLPKPSVDTGMGLERLASVIQNVESNYLIDSMQFILQGFAEIVGKPYGKNAEDDVALRVLTDHIRPVSFLMADGVQPSNEGRVYVLRRILRRAIRYGKKLGCNEPFFHKGVEILEKQMGKAYPELTQNLSAVSKMIFHEETKFFETLENGLKLIETKTKGLKKGATFPGAIAFQLYDTYGFPLDLTEVILNEKGLKLDTKGFDEELETQRTRSKANWKGSGEESVSSIYKELAAEGLKTEFHGYEKLETKSKILAILVDGKKVKKISSGQVAEIVLDKTPFYGEGGGQVGDQGVLKSKSAEFIVENTIKPSSQIFVHRGNLKTGTLEINSELEAKVDRTKRMQTRINHTITHILHAALQKVLGDHIKQAGSLVHPDYLRFDFSHFQQVQKSELKKIEAMVNARIRENTPVQVAEESLEKAIAGGAKAFFDEKYGEKVRVLTVGDFSKELCGGTHAERLGEAGLFKIVSETSVASGVRRIVGLTGEKAYHYILEEEQILESAAELLKAPEKEIPARIEKLLKEKSELQKKLQNQALAPKRDPGELVTEIEGVKTIVEVVKAENVKDLRPLSDQYKQKLKSGVVVLGAAVEGRSTVIVSVTDDIVGEFQMPKIVERLSVLLNGKGGGKPNFAQVGGANVSQLSEQNLTQILVDHLQSISVNV
jgi:alanyl-tRNA synthetase